MIAIIDNGGEYSDHRIIFLDLPDELPREVLETMAVLHSYQRGKLLATAAGFSWWHGKVHPVAEFLDDVEEQLLMAPDEEAVMVIPPEKLQAVKEWIDRLRANAPSTTVSP